MSNITKIQKDYLRSRGIEDPAQEVFDIIEPIPIKQLLKIVVSENRSVPDQVLADRYNVNQNTIKSIKLRTRK